MTDEIQNIPFAALRPSALNTRKVFDPAAIERLADSIFAQGIQQNLVARLVPGAGGGRPANPAAGAEYEIVAGERRYRALARLIERGERTPETPMPVRVIACDDRTLLELNLLENLQREDLHPLDEAEGYAALVKAGRSIAAIAGIVPFTKRHVELRLALAANLSDEAKAAFRADRLTLAQARVLAAYAAPERQAPAIEMIEDDEEGYTAGDLKRALTQDMVPAKTAFFDPALYTGPRVQDPDRPEVEYFTDVAAFAKLQAQAVRAAEARLKETYAWVEVQHGHYFPDYNYGRSKDKKIAGAVIFVDKGNRKVEIHTDLLKPAQVQARAKAKAGTKQKAGAKSPDKPIPPEAYLPSRAGLRQAKIAKTRALRAAVIESGRTPAMIAVILGLMGARGDVHLRPEHGTPDDERITSPAADAVFDKYRRRFQGLLEKPWTKDDRRPRLGRDAAAGAAFEILLGFAPAEIEELFAALVADTLGSYPGYRAELGDGAIAAGLARECGAEVTRHWTIDAAYLETCNKRPLERIAASTGLAYASSGQGPGGPMPAAAIAKMKAKDLRAAILKHLAAEPGAAVFLPAPFHFGTAAQLLALAAPAPKPDPAPNPKAPKPDPAPNPQAGPAKPKINVKAKIKSPRKIKEARTRAAKKAGARLKAAVIEGFRP